MLAQLEALLKVREKVCARIPRVDHLRCAEFHGQRLLTAILQLAVYQRPNVNSYLYRAAILAGFR